MLTASQCNSHTLHASRLKHCNANIQAAALKAGMSACSNKHPPTACSTSPPDQTTPPCMQKSTHLDTNLFVAAAGSILNAHASPCQPCHPHAHSFQDQQSGHRPPPQQLVLCPQDHVRQSWGRVAQTGKLVAKRWGSSLGTGNKASKWSINATQRRYRGHWSNATTATTTAICYRPSQRLKQPAQTPKVKR